VAALRGKYQNAMKETRMVADPSMMKRYRHGLREPLWIWKTPKERSPENALAMD
jgi:hypothetical protein